VVEGAAAIAERYGTHLSDESRAAGRAERLAFPRSEADVAEALARAAAAGMPVTVASGRTGIVAGAVPEGGLLLSTERMDALAVEPPEEEKGSGPFCAKHPEGRCGKRVLTPFLALAAAGALVLGALAAPAGGAEEKKPEKAKDAPKWAPAVKPKELSANVKKGLGWLAAGQLESGAWTQGEESAQMGGTKLDKPSVADTCVAALALLRSGSSPKEGDYAKHLKKAVEFVCSEIEKSKENSLFVTEVRGTRVQLKIGTYIDTFMACMLLSEVKGRMADEQGETRRSTR
jgi:hypothetical protein